VVFILLFILYTFFAANWEMLARLDRYWMGLVGGWGGIIQGFYLHLRFRSKVNVHCSEFRFCNTYVMLLCCNLTCILDLLACLLACLL
jgi:uncharacterized membrane protein